MKTRDLIIAVLMSTAVNSAVAENTSMDALLQPYVSRGAAAADAEQGRYLWQKTFQAAGEFTERSCASCHTENLAASGKHIKTGKLIEPMSPSVNPQRLTDNKKIEKWFKRNCKWTMGRECTAQKKASLLLYINN